MLKTTVKVRSYVTWDLYYHNVENLTSWNLMFGPGIILAVSYLPTIRGVLGFKIWTKRGSWKNCSEIEGLVKRGSSLRKGRVSKLFHQLSFRNACFCYYWNNFLCLVNIHTCCNQQIHFLCSFLIKKLYIEKFVLFLLLFLSIFL